MRERYRESGRKKRRGDEEDMKPSKVDESCSFDIATRATSPTIQALRCKKKPSYSNRKQFSKVH